MKPLKHEFTKSIIVHQTPRQQLVLSLMERYKDITHSSCVEEFCDILNEALSGYEIRKSDLTSVLLELPRNLLGSTVTVTYKGEQEWNFHGKVVEVLYRDTEYDFSHIKALLELPEMLEEQKEMLKLTPFDETKPKIYHRLVLNEDNRGIIIVPCLAGITIKQE